MFVYLLICMCVCLYIKRKYRRKEMFYLMMLSTHFIYGYIVLDIIDEKQLK